MVMESVIRSGAAGAAKLRHVHDRPLLAHDPGAGERAHGDRFWPSAEPADLAEQHEAGEARVRVIRADLLDILPHPAEFGFADALAIDEDLDRLDLHEADHPAVDVQQPAAVDCRSVDEELHWRLVEKLGLASRSGMGIERRDLDMLRRDVDAQRTSSDLPVLGAHAQQRLDRAAGGAWQVEAQNEAGIRGMITIRVEPGNIRTRQPVGGASDNGTVEGGGDLGDRGGGQGPAIDRQTRAAVCRAGDPERLDGDEDRRLRRGACCLMGERFGGGGLAVALDQKAARRADQQVMQERVGRRLAAGAALFEVEGGVEIRMRVAPLMRALFEVMHKRVDIALRDVRISPCVMFGVEEAGFSYGFVIAEQRFHSSPV